MRVSTYCVTNWLPLQVTRMPGYLGVLREAGVLERPLDSAAGVWLIIKDCCSAAIRAWADHNFPDGKQKLHVEHKPPAQKTQGKGRQIDLNFPRVSMRIGNRGCYQRNLRFWPRFALIKTIRSKPKRPNVNSLTIEIEDERKRRSVEAEALQKSTHNLPYVSRILSSAQKTFTSGADRISRAP